MGNSGNLGAQRAASGSRGVYGVLLLAALLASLMLAAITALGPGAREAQASPPRAEGCYYPHQPGQVYQQECVGVSRTGSVGTAQARAEAELRNWEVAFSVSCTRDSFSVIPRDNGAVEVPIYATCYPAA
jgi:uncharacterized protein (DUF58 family)